MFTIILFLLICGIGIGGFIIWMRQKQSATEEEIAVKENQSLIVARIYTINGNEITFAEAEEMDLSYRRAGEMGENNGASKNSGKETESSIDENQNGEEKNASLDNSLGGAQMPQGSMGESRGRPDGSMTGGGERSSEGMLGGRNKQDDGGISGGDMANGDSLGNSDFRFSSGRQEESETESGKTKNKTIYRVTGEEQTMLIPVGTTVTTQFGTTTTFSRLAAGDTVKILLEKNENNKEIIVGIWMIQ